MSILNNLGYLAVDSLTLSIYIATVILGVVLFQIYRARDVLADVPSPPNPSWLWGNDKEIYETNVGDFYLKWFAKFGFIMKTRGAFLHPDILVVADTKACTHILQTHIYDYHHSTVARPRIERLLGRSLVWVEGSSDHRRMRNLVAPSLTAENVKAMSHRIYAAAEDSLALTEKAITAKGGSEIFNAMDVSGRTTLDITGRVIFDHDFGVGVGDDAQSILTTWRSSLNWGLQFKGFVAEALVRRFPWINHLPIEANTGQSIVKLTIQNGLAKELIKRSSGDSLASDSKEDDLLSVLLKANAEGKITSQEVSDHIVTFLMAGHETTAQTLAYTMWVLGQKPEIQEKLRKEVVEFAGEPTYDDITTKLPYLDAVTKEALRMFPALPYMERIATKDDVLPLQTAITTPDGRKVTEVPIRKGQTIIIPIISMNRLDSIWGDALTFRPERWFEPLPHPELLARGWGNTLTFSDGPRNCVGYRLGLFQFKVVLFTFVKSLQFSDVGVKLGHKLCSSLQPFIEGDLENAPNIPVRVSGV